MPRSRPPHLDIELDAPCLRYLDNRVGGSLAKALGRLASPPGRTRPHWASLDELIKELTDLRSQVQKASGGPAELRLKLAETERRAESVGEPELRVEYERRSRELRKQLADG